MNYVCLCPYFSGLESGLEEKPVLLLTPPSISPAAGQITVLKGCKWLWKYLADSSAEREQGPHACPTHTSHYTTCTLAIPTLPTCPCLRSKGSCQGQRLRAKALFIGQAFLSPSPWRFPEGRTILPREVPRGLDHPPLLNLPEASEWNE